MKKQRRKMVKPLQEKERKKQFTKTKLSQINQSLENSLDICKAQRQHEENNKKLDQELLVVND